VGIFSAVVTYALFWLPRIAVVLLLLTAATWAADKWVGWLIPMSGDPAPQFETGNSEQNALFARLLQAEFLQIKNDLTSGAATVKRLLEAWKTEFEETNRKRQAGRVNRQNQAAAQGLTEKQAKVIPSEIKASVDLASVAAVVEGLKLFSNIDTAKLPDIKIASVELGPVLRWLVDMLRPASENKVAVFDENSTALIEGPIISDGRSILELEPSNDSKKRTPLQIVTPVAYEILYRKLASTDPKIDFGSWAALRDFVIGTKNMARLVSQPQPSQDDRTEWNKKGAEAARLIEGAGAAAQDWRFIALASFLFERSQDFDNAIRVLDRYAEFTGSNKEDADGREARIAYLRERRVESTVMSALESKKGDGAVFAATATALARLPSVLAARKLHRFDGADRTKVKIAIVSGAKPPWFGIDGPPDMFPLEEFLDLYGAELAQVVRALSPSADVVFAPVGRKSPKDPIEQSEILKALKLADSDVPIILLPFAPLQGPEWEQMLEHLMQKGQLVIVPAGNSGKPMVLSWATKTLVAESVDLEGRRSEFSSEVKGSLGAVGELPTVDLTQAGPTVAVGTGTAYAAAALAAIAVESVARQPTLKGAALRDALISAAAEPVDTNAPPIARVVIPR
jgi:hypothetical protein